MYSYPAGTRFGEGQPTETRVVRKAQPFTSHITNVSYNLAHFADVALMERLEVKNFIEDAIPARYRGGVPTDIETASTIHRTYPNPILEAESWREQLATQAHARMKQKRDGGFLVGDVLFDSDERANIAYLNIQTVFANNPQYVQRWKASGNTWVDMDLALFAQVAAGFQVCNSGAYDWLDSISRALADAPDTYEALSAIEALINT